MLESLLKHKAKPTDPPYDSVTGLVNEIASETIHGLHQSTLWYQRASYDDRESGRSGKALAFAMPCRFSG